MSASLFQRLSALGQIPHSELVRALVASEERRCSLVESLIALDRAHAGQLLQCIGRDGISADPFWRPDPCLVRSLPPGLCERLLAFPFRERAGAVEVATALPLDELIKAEFEYHLRRPVVLLRGHLQALLAAAGAPVRLSTFGHAFSSTKPFSDEEAPLPLVRKVKKKSHEKPRTATSPGLGVAGTGEGLRSTVPPASGVAARQRDPERRRHEAVLAASDPTSLAKALSRVLPGPLLIFEIQKSKLTLRASSAESMNAESTIAESTIAESTIAESTIAESKEEAWEVSLEEDSAFLDAVERGVYIGPLFAHPVHSRFQAVFSCDARVRMERVGTRRFGLLVATSAEIPNQVLLSALEAATESFLRWSARASFLQGR